MADLMKQYPNSYKGCNLDIAKANCTLETCCLAQSYFLYRPSYGGNLFFTIFFAIFIIPHVWLGIKHKTWGFSAGMGLGLLLETVGYLARLGLHSSPYSNGSFLMYLIALTIAPVFITAAIYLCLSRIIVVYGEHLSYLRPRTTAIGFMCSDGLSLILQAVGGAWAESATQNNEDNQGGINVMIAGLLLQAISLAAFVGLWAWFQIRVFRGNPTHDPAKVYTRRRPFFYAFNAGLLLATATIVIRSIYRVAELWGGFSGKLWNEEVDFMILDGSMISLAVLLLTILHPGLAFGGQWHAANWSLRSKSKERLGSDSLDRQEREMKILWK